MAHEFAASTDTEYDECRRCGLLAEPLVTVWVTVPCAMHPCPEQSHDDPCVLLADGDRTTCSYCDRVGGWANELAGYDALDEGWDEDLALSPIELLY